ncbi:MAG: DUF368 domain-containing protein [Rhodothermales bacterium]
MSVPVRQYVKHYLQGLLMGAADVVPGVSGGTMALIVGIYSRLIDSLSSGFSALLALFRFQVSAARKHLFDVEWRLVVPLLLGIGSAIVLAAAVILDLILRYPEHSQGFFFGLVAASLIVPWQRLSKPGVRELLIAVAAAITAFLLVGLPQSASADPTLLRIFASAAVAICAMILPGVSGAFLLKALGLYEASLTALRTLDSLYVIVFVLGAATGLGLFSKLLNYLLKHHHDATMAALVGLMAGALRALWPYLGENGELLLPRAGDPIWSVFVIGVIGFALVFSLIIFSDRFEPVASEQA